MKLDRLDVDACLRGAALLAIPLLGLLALCLRAPAPDKSEGNRGGSMLAPASANSVSQIKSADTPIRTERDVFERSPGQGGTLPHAQAAADLPVLAPPAARSSSPSGFAQLDGPASRGPSRIEIELLDPANSKRDVQDVAERWILPENMHQEIEKRSETEFLLARAAIDGIFEHGADLLLGIVLVPEAAGVAQDGGLRIDTVRSDSLFELLGLESGDLVITLGGQTCSSLEAARNILESARHSDRLVAGLERRGQRFDLDLRVR